jgi:autotransporter-associated beta strand protein
LTLTDNNYNEARTAWFDTPQTISSGFTASFTYTPSGTKAADGFTFTVQNASSPLTQLGGTGGYFAYGSGTHGSTPASAVGNSGAVEFNIYSVGTGFGTNGTITTNQSVSPVSLASGDPIQINLSYNPSAQTLTEVLTDTSNSNTKTITYTGVNFNTILGGTTGYIGFTGGTGGAYSTQTISNFSFATGIQTFTNNLSVTANSTINVTSALTATVGGLSIGSNTLYLTSADASGSAYSLTTGSVTLSGNPTFDVAASAGGGTGTLILGALNDGGVARTIAIPDVGVVTLTAAATSLVSGTTVNITGGGTLNSNNATALGTYARVNISSGTTFGVGASQQISSLAGAGSVVLSGGANLTIGNTDNLSTSFGGTVSGNGGINVGGGSLTLSGSNSYSGGTTVTTGSLYANVANSLGSGSLTVSGGSAYINSYQVLSNAAGITVNGGNLYLPDSNGQYAVTTLNGTGGTIHLSSSGNASPTNLTVSGGGTFAGVISDANTGSGTGVGSLTVTGGNLTLTGANTYTGPTNITAGILTVGPTASLGSGSLTVNGTLNLSNASQSVAALNGTGSVNLTVGGASTTNLTVTAGGSFGGSITDNGSGGSVTLTGGTLTLSNYNSYSGGTTVSGGTLLANDTEAATGFGPVTLKTAGTLGGTGVILNSSPVLISSGGTISPGPGAAFGAVGVLNTNDQTWNGGTYVFKTNVGTNLAQNNYAALTAGQTNQDFLVINGNLNLVAGTAFHISIAPQSVTLSPNATFTIAYANAVNTVTDAQGDGSTPLTPGTFPSSDFAVSDTNSQYTWSVSMVPDSTDGGSGYDIDVTAVAPVTPEPGSLGLLGVASLGLLRRRRSARAASNNTWE